ncbi:MAG: cytochrome c oxidase subunit II [Gammaproteobacteria bacterium]|jgi:cytochrome c oxidase subunit 2|nr:cytochrome c oxidase subunit II [Gammaproteobacteria bacterium]
MVFHTIKRAARIALGLALALAAGTARAMDINMPEGVTPTSHEVYDLHMMVFYVCCGIGIVVFGVMIIAIVRFRKAAGAKPAQFHESTALEIAWTIVPVIILVAMTIPAAKVLVRMADTSDPQMSIKIVGYQWKWEYDYLQDGFSFFSMLAKDSDQASQLRSGIDPATVPNYLRDVDHPLVVPTGEKIRLLITSDDVIHSWWMPDFGGKTDANPGFINQEWIKVEEPGVYRGACAELCGRWHGFMPIVVVAKTPADYQAWVKAMKAANGKYVSPYDGSLEDNGSPVAFEQTTYGSLMAPQVVATTAPKAGQPAAAAAPPAQAPAAPAAAWDMQTAMARGKQVYDQNCASCHMPDGKGNPALGAKAIAGGEIPNGPLAAHIALVLKGKGIMPAWGTMLSDLDLAAVITYERNAFGNHKGDLVKPEDIKAAR